MTTGRRGWHNDDPRWSVLENEADEPMDEGGMTGDDGEDCLDPMLLAVARELRHPVTLDAVLDARIMAAVEAEGAPGAQSSGLTAEWGVVTAPAQAEPAAASAAMPAAAPARPGPARRRAAAIWSWLREPRTLRVSPLGGLAGLAAAAVVTVVAVRNVEPGQPTGTDATPAVAADAAPVAPAMPAAPTGTAHPDVQVVQFVLVAPKAHSVALVGDFNDWDSGATPLRAAGGGRRVWSVEVPLTPGRHRYAFVVDGEEWVPDPAAPRAPGADFGAPSSVVTVADQRS